MTTGTSAQEPVVERDTAGRPIAHRWPLSNTPSALTDFLTDVFTRYWDRIVFGPVLDGAAYEWKCPCSPDRIERDGEFLTIGFGGPHFHLCIGTDSPATEGDPEREARMRQLRPTSAMIYRSLDSRGAPNSGGFQIHNGNKQCLLSIYFPNPFVLSDDQLADEPDWSRLDVWRDISKRYLGREPESFDETSHGFTW
jgi:hypothetical protein